MSLPNARSNDKDYYSTFTYILLIYLLGYTQSFVLRDVRILLQTQGKTSNVFITEKVLLLQLHKIRCYSKLVFRTVCLEDKLISLKFKYLWMLSQIP